MGVWGPRPQPAEPLVFCAGILPPCDGVVSAIMPKKVGAKPNDHQALQYSRCASSII